MSEYTLSVLDAVRSRCSIRAFRPDPVERSVLEQILAAAAWAPSGSNIQPWKVHVLTGSSKQALTRKILATLDDAEENARHSEVHAYYPTHWQPPYIDRRRALGWGLYSLLGITRQDTAAMQAQHARNFQFFDAPVGLMFTLDSCMERGSWLDFGMFLQNVMLVAKAFGLDTCPQAAFNRYHRIVAEHLELPADELLVCGMSLGYADPDKVENSLARERAGLDSFVRFHS